MIGAIIFSAAFGFFLLGCLLSALATDQYDPMQQVHGDQPWLGDR